MFVKTHSSNCLSAGMYHNILLQKCISFSEVKNIPRNPTKFAIHSFLSCINATGTSKTILGAVHHAIATRRVHHTETIAIWKLRFIGSFSSECEITREVVWADTLKDGCWSLLVKGRHLDFTCWFRKTKSKRRKRICWSKRWSGYADIGTKKLRFVLDQLLLCPCGKQVHHVC